MNNGLALWPAAGPYMRELLIRLACDGDIRWVAPETQKLTVAQALEVLK